MPRDGKATRDRLLDAAQDLILEHGFSGTTVDRVIGSTGTTKGTFFYHFDSKAELARALIDRYAELDRRHLEQAFKRAETAGSDPVEQLKEFVVYFEEMFGQLTTPYPGCLFASYIYEAGLIEESTLKIISDATLLWRNRLAAKLREAAKTRPPRRPFDADAVADMFTVILEGAFILSKSLKDPGIVVAQLRHYRQYLELLWK